MNGAQDKPFVAFDPWDPTSHVPDPREQLTAPRPVVLSTSQLEAAEEIRARAAASVYADHSDAAAAADAGADFIESALGATPTLAEMTADLGKLTLPEVIYVKDCECSIAGRARVRIGPPVVCLVCGKAWTRTYGPSNDAPSEVQIEIRAAELSGNSWSARSEEEWSGWEDYPDFGDPKTDANWAGWLCCAINEHDFEAGA